MLESPQEQPRTERKAHSGEVLTFTVAQRELLGTFWVSCDGTDDKQVCGLADAEVSWCGVDADFSLSTVVS